MTEVILFIFVTKIDKFRNLKKVMRQNFMSLYSILFMKVKYEKVGIV